MRKNSTSRLVGKTSTNQKCHALLSSCHKMPLKTLHNSFFWPPNEKHTLCVLHYRNVMYLLHTQYVVSLRILVGTFGEHTHDLICLLKVHVASTTYPICCLTSICYWPHTAYTKFDRPITYYQLCCAPTFFVVYHSSTSSVVHLPHYVGMCWIRT